VKSHFLTSECWPATAAWLIIGAGQKQHRTRASFVTLKATCSLVMTSSRRDIIVTQRMFPTQSAWKDRYLGGIFSYSNTTKKYTSVFWAAKSTRKIVNNKFEHSFQSLRRRNFYPTCFSALKMLLKGNVRIPSFFVMRFPDHERKLFFNENIYFLNSRYKKHSCF
jgi:hypothetical protein